ncbi:DUF222 domain-containing protein [Candidatus Palauibacter sp.]|uniref:DUF222 domain-containing protein n=1 Tax=Candidatus Palauibacter sp. TaxID=3101350 RepID=UPI003B5A074A
MPHETPHHALSDPLGDEIAELCAHLDAGQYRLLTLLYRYDRAELWTGWRSCAHWLSWRTGVTLGPARERVRVARCLASLPRTAAEMEKGRLSWSKTRALTRIATPGNETRLLEFARDATASQVERLVRAQRSAEAAMAAEDGESEMSARRHLTVRVGEDGMYRIRGRLLPEVGALLMEALDAAGDELYRAERAAEASEPKLPAAPGERHHDALGAWLEDRTDAEVQLVVHTVAVDEGEPVVSTEDGSHVPAGTSRRLFCDPEVVEVTRGLDNLMHEGGWRVEMGVAGAARFTDPEGRIVPAVPPARPDVKAPLTVDAGLGRWHRQKGINPWTSTSRWQGDRLDLDWALWVLWGQMAA